MTLLTVLSSFCASVSSFFGGNNDSTTATATGITTAATTVGASLAFLFNTSSVNRQFEMAALDRKWLAHLASVESELARKEIELARKEIKLARKERELDRKETNKNFEKLFQELRELRESKGTTSQDLQGQSHLIPNQEDTKSEATKTEDAGIAGIEKDIGVLDGEIKKLKRLISDIKNEMEEMTNAGEFQDIPSEFIYVAPGVPSAGAASADAASADAASADAASGAAATATATASAATIV